MHEINKCKMQNKINAIKLYSLLKSFCFFSVLANVFAKIFGDFYLFVPKLMIGMINDNLEYYTALSKNNSPKFLAWNCRTVS